MAKHRLNDLPLALRYAKALATHATGPGVPHWARQMQIFLHEDMGEYETAACCLAVCSTAASCRIRTSCICCIERLNQLKGAEKSSAPSEK